MKKIIHLSDLHVGYKDCGKNLSKLVKKIKSKYKPSKDYVVVITGDIVDNANKKGAYKEASKILKKLEKDKYQVLVVPGNHDYGNGGVGNKKYVALFKKAFYGTDNITYPKLDIVDNIVFIGLDSMAKTFDWPLDIVGADGELGKEQRNNLKKLISSSELKKMKKVVYLHHHPFDGKGKLHMLKDYKEFMQIVEGKIDCLLFGHNHDGNQYPGVWGIEQCYDASSSTGKKAPVTPMRIIKL